MNDHAPVHEELRRLVRRARLLVAAEREGGVVDLPGTPLPAAAAPSAPAPRPAVAAHPVAPSRSAPAVPAVPAGRAPVPEGRFVPLVRALDLPPDVLAPFGDLPSEVAACRRCGLCEGRTQTVFGEGSAPARLVFCGEGPGADEDRSGRPFVGRAGELLTAMIEKGLRMRREDVFILNAVKCRPPGNRTPAPEEIAACRPHLERQLGVLRPQVIVALGNPACQALLGPLLGHVGGITSIRGKEFQGYGATIVPTYHPAYLLRNLDAKGEVWTDLKLVMRLLAGGGGPT